MIIPVLLCGGSGTRLWPLSRRSHPKQFSSLFGTQSLAQATARRLSGDGFAAPLVVTGADYRFIISEQLQEVGITPEGILIEPEGRNTGPALLAAALHAFATDPDAILLAAPTDHLVPDADAFRAAVRAGLPAVGRGQIVTFGVSPAHAETGYGWLSLAENPGDFSARPLPLQGFVEKPDAARAEAMLQAGTFLWNAGIFLFSAKTLIAAFEAHAPAMIAPVRAALEKAKTDLNFLRLDPESWGGAEAISIDYAVMEHATNLMVVPYSAGWSDLGGWEAVWRETGPDEDGVSLHGPARAIDCKNSLLRSESEGLELVGLGLENIVAVAMPDAVLIADKNRSQEVKLVVEDLKARGVKQAESFPRDHRPWGWFETLALADRFQVKRIVVHPGAALSLQSHVHRSEHWIVVSGTARVTVDGDVRLMTENQSVYIPLGATHRLENPGKVPMVLIEVQTGAYLGEDDIIRYEDIYARS